MRILLVEDDETLSGVMEEQLSQAGYLADRCGDGESALFYALRPEYGYDLILLDRLLPVLDGLTVLKAIRRAKICTPVLVITGLGELEDRIDGLDCGADDYLVKPFHMGELLARVRALSRRPAEMADRRALSAYDLELDPGARQLRCRGRSVPLTGREAEVLAALMEQPERTLSRDQLLWRVWGGAAEVEAGNVDTYIHFLRKRLRTLDCHAAIRTVYGAGYRLEAAP